MSEEEIKDLIVNVALNDDMQSFKKIYFHYYQRLFQLAKAITKHTETAEEIVDDVFMKVWQKREGMVYVNNLSVYLYVATKNHSLNHNSKENQPSTTHIDDIKVEIKDLTPGIEDTIITNDLMKIINQSIKELPEQSKLVYKLVKEDGLKYKEVAKILNISPKTVEYHIGSALKKIAQSLAGIVKPQSKHLGKKYLSN